MFVASTNFEFAFYFVCLGIFLDFFDGFFARLFKVSSPLGLQLDSLADMVTSGVVPGYVMFQMMSNNSNLPFPYFQFLGFLITLGSCYRLANFNIDTRQTDSFIGLPTPANALFILSLPLVLRFGDSLIVLEILTNPWILLAIALFSAYIMNAEIPLFSLKIKKFDFKENSIQIFYLVVSLLLLIFLHYSAIPLVILLYILLSFITNKSGKK
jgi:CDP-diacylglycerol--serine O-phosphatidyltransferase